MKLVLFQGFLVGRNARIKLFGELYLALAHVISLQDVSRRGCSLMHF